LRDIEKLISKKIPVIDDHPYPLQDHNPVAAPKQQQRRHTTSTGSSNGNAPSKRPARTNANAGGGEKKKWFGKPRTAR